MINQINKGTYLSPLKQRSTKVGAGVCGGPKAPRMSVFDRLTHGNVGTSIRSKKVIDELG